MSPTPHSPNRPDRPAQRGCARSGGPTGPVDCVVLSPQPAGALAGHPRDAELLDAAVTGVREIFERLRPRLATGGVVWLHVAEPPRPPGADITGLGWRMALAVQADGWLLRNAITTTPTRGDGGPNETADGAMVFLLTRGRHYYFALPTRATPTRSGATTVPGKIDRGSVDPGAALIAAGATGEWPGPVWPSERRRERAAASHRTRSRIGATRRPAGACAGGHGTGAQMNPGDVWWLPPETPVPGSSSGPCRCTQLHGRERPHGRPHPGDPRRGGERRGDSESGSLYGGAMPLMTAARAILLGCPPRGVVHDPLAMCGHGPVAQAARQLGRRFCLAEGSRDGHDEALPEHHEVFPRADEAPFAPGEFLPGHGSGESSVPWGRQQLRASELPARGGRGAVARGVRP